MKAKPELVALPDRSAAAAESSVPLIHGMVLGTSDLSKLESRVGTLSRFGDSGLLICFRGKNCRVNGTRMRKF